MLIAGTTSLNTTSYKVVLPFYVYAALAFLVGTALLMDAGTAFSGHHFHPRILAITHCMALGWGTMMIMGAAHQLVPVIVESKLYSNLAAYLAFGLSAIGIPLLVYGFYTFNMGRPAQWGGLLIVAAILVYLINLAMTMAQSKKENIHAFFIFMATLWLLATAILGLVLVYNFTGLFMSRDSLSYLSLHAHIGIAGWFLLMVMGVGSRLIPMFLLSKYTNTRLLWWIFGLINMGLTGFVFIFLYATEPGLMLLPIAVMLIALVLFVNYCHASWKNRLRRQVDDQMKLSLLSVVMMMLPLVLLLTVFGAIYLTGIEENRLILTYGFLILFGWITSIILGMSFKTLPFIVWNKLYHKRVGMGKTPNPKDLFSAALFKGMCLAYIPGILLFAGGLVFNLPVLLPIGALCLFLTAVLYNLNILKILTHKVTDS